MQGLEDAEGTLGCGAGAGVATAPRLQQARLPAPPGELNLVPQPRGAFSGLVAVPVER